ncbi:MAG: phosphoribosyltransferase [Candidatus Methylacidiphilales bacterium]|nr:phosphoribosyltransferase family protein [Candidatus Methylacidiphilales bacterium]
MHFTDRFQAGRFIASKLLGYQEDRDVIVLALPRGGVPVACEVATTLRVPLDLVVVRKIGVPGNRELGVGALASGGIEYVSDEDIDLLRIDKLALREVVEEERAELLRRERRFRHGLPFPAVKGKTVILVDDGLATGFTMGAALQAVRNHGAARVVVAVPVGARATCDALRADADEVVCAYVPASLESIGHWYADFTQLTDVEVESLLRDRACNPTFELIMAGTEP